MILWWRTKDQMTSADDEKESLDATFVPTTEVNTSLNDYIAFHGMLIAPGAAQRCIESFTGAALFADQSSYDDGAEPKNFDYNRTPLRFTLWSYYVLAALSLTSLCTLLGQTKLLTVIDHKNLGFKEGQGECVDSIAIPNLHIPAYAISYVIQRSNELKHKSENPVQEIKLTRRFEYTFGGYLSVMMIHFVCTNGRKHLVEVYRLEDSVMGVFTKALLKPLHLLQSVMNSTRRNKDL